MRGAISRGCRRRISRALGVGYVPQGRGLFAGMTVRENLSLGRLARKTDGSHGVVWSEEQILHYFPRLKERMDVAADYLSGGEQQMVAVARAMSGNVKLLLLDEPFEGLAPAVILELFGVFDLLRRHTSIVIVEHNLDLVLALADRVFALERGAVFHQGPAVPLLTDLEYRKKICGCDLDRPCEERSDEAGTTHGVVRDRIQDQSSATVMVQSSPPSRQVRMPTSSRNGHSLWSTRANRLTRDLPRQSRTVSVP